jgi:subtilisin family serine protease
MTNRTEAMFTLRNSALAGSIVSLSILLGATLPAHAQTRGLEAKSSAAHQIERTLSSKGTVRVILQHATPNEILRGGLQDAQAAAAVASFQDSILRSLAPKGNAEVQRRQAARQMKRMPLMALTVTRAELARLAADKRVERIWADEVMTINLDQSAPLIGTARAAALPGSSVDDTSGAGTTIAIIDTGVDSRHPFLAGRVTREACFSSAVPADNRTSLCPNGETSQIGTGAAQPTAGIGGFDHGTHVAGIAAGLKSGTAGPARGIAPGAKIFAIQIFSRVQGTAQCGGTTTVCMNALTSDFLAALDHIVSVMGDLPERLASVNMSVGGSRSEDTCDDDPRKAAFDALRAAGVAPVVSAGNSGFTNATGRPACISSAITVGSTTKDDTVSPFSNISPIVDILAPGSAIMSSVPGGGFAIKSGTSMSAPHITGAFAVLRAKFPNASLDDLEAAIKSTGTPIRDTRAGGVHTLPRINIDRALQALATGATAGAPARDATPPPATSRAPAAEPGCIAAADPSTVLREPAPKGRPGCP